MIYWEGMLKIGFQGQTTEKSTYSTLGSRFRILPEGYFSVGQDVDYYQKISNLPESVKVSLLEALKDIAYAPELSILLRMRRSLKRLCFGMLVCLLLKGSLREYLRERIH